MAVAPVRATFTYEGLRVIESGLEPGQPVIVEGLQLVRAGMTVKTEPAAPDAPPRRPTARPRAGRRSGNAGRGEARPSRSRKP